MGRTGGRGYARMSGCVLVVEPDGRIRSVLSGSRALLGSRLEDLEGSRWPSLPDPVPQVQLPGPAGDVRGGVVESQNRHPDDIATEHPIHPQPPGLSGSHRPVEEGHRDVPDPVQGAAGPAGPGICRGPGIVKQNSLAGPPHHDPQDPGHNGRAPPTQEPTQRCTEDRHHHPGDPKRFPLPGTRRTSFCRHAHGVRANGNGRPWPSQIREGDPGPVDTIRASGSTVARQSGERLGSDVG